MERKYYPFLIGASPYKDYWAVISPKNIRPMVISKAAIRGGELNQPYLRKIIFGKKVYSIFYCYDLVLKSYMTSNKKDTEVLKDSFGRNIQFFYGVFGINITPNKSLLDEARKIALMHLPKFLNDKKKNFKVESEALKKQFMKDSIEFKELEPIIVDKDVFIGSSKPKTKRTTPTVKKEEDIGSTIIDEEQTESQSESNRSKFGLRKIVGIALIAAGGGLSIYAKTINWVSASAIAAGTAFLISKEKENNAEH